MNFLRGRISLCLCLMLMCVCCLMPNQVASAATKPSLNSGGTTKQIKEWHFKDANGNDMVARLKGRTLQIAGNGAIPDYTPDCLGNRPWDKQTYYSLEVGEGVTSIGAYAFVNNEYLRTINFYSSTFVDATAFKSIATDATFTVCGTNITTKNIGKLPYTSMDSIAYFIQENNGKMSVQFANAYMVSLAKNKSSYPGLLNVYTVNHNSAYVDAEHPAVDCTSSIALASGEKANIMIQQKIQGKLANEVFGAVIDDYHYVASYNVTVSNQVGNTQTISDTIQFVMTIPAAYQMPGRHFRLIGIGAGEVMLLDDLDSNDATITFDTKYTTTCYALVYKDVM